jgi:hypothetical protein
MKVSIKNFTDLIKLNKTDISFNQVLKVCNFWHCNNFATPLFLESTNKKELDKELQLIEKSVNENKKPLIFGLNSLTD